VIHVLVLFCVTHGNVDDMEVKAVLGSNNQPGDHADLDVRMPGIGTPTLLPLSSHFPNNLEGSVGEPGTPQPVTRANQGADFFHALAWKNSKLPEKRLCLLMLWLL